MVSITFPTFDHIDQIVNLNRKYLIDNLTDEEKQKGFVRIEHFRDGLKHIILNKEIVIAINKDNVVGYYLIGKKSAKASLSYQKNKAISLFETNKIKFDNIGFGCQVCIDETYRNNGLFGQMLNELTKAVKEKYTHLLCSVSDDNTISMKTHISNGWQLIETFEATNFFIYDTTKSITTR